MEFTRRQFIISAAALGTSALTYSCANLPLVRQPITHCVNCFAVMSGSLISPSRTRGPHLAIGDKLLHRAVMAAARSRIDACFLLGNMIDNASVDAADFRILKRILLEYPIQMHLSPGNHETTPLVPGLSLSKAEFVRAAIGAGLSPPGGTSYNVDLPANVTAVVVDTTVAGKPGGLLTPKAISSIKKLASAKSDRTILLFLHHPLVVPARATTLKASRPKNYGMLLDAIKTSGNIAAVFSSNTGVPFVIKQRGVTFVGCGDLAMYPSTFLIVRIGETALHAEFHGTADEAEFAFARRLLEGDKERLALADKVPPGTKFLIERRG